MKNATRTRLASMRKEMNAGGTLLESAMSPDPIVQFNEWLAQAIEHDPSYANAMTLATASADGFPDARTMLLRAADANGFTFFTNYGSSKGKQLSENPRACIHFFWKELQRQVRVYGGVYRIPEEESDFYFASRPIESRIGAWASRQSEVIAGRRELDAAFEKAMKRFAADEVVRPPFWGGFRLVTERIEFWQGGSARLHDRICYSMSQGGNWIMERLMP